jgi:hypothetical protein
MKIVIEIIRDVLAFAGLGSVTFGAWLAYPPAGYVVGGMAALLLSRGMVTHVR